MTVPLHVGIEHPSLVWILVASVVAFGAGLAVDRLRSAGRDRSRTDAAPAEEPAE